MAVTGAGGVTTGGGVTGGGVVGFGGVVGGVCPVPGDGFVTGGNSGTGVISLSQEVSAADKPMPASSKNWCTFIVLWLAFNGKTSQLPKPLPVVLNFMKKINPGDCQGLRAWFLKV